MKKTTKKSASKAKKAVRNLEVPPAKSATVRAGKMPFPTPWSSDKG